MVPDLRRFNPRGVVQCLFVLAAFGCNAVLGIEPAELEQAGASLSCHWPANGPTLDCPTCNDGCTGLCKVDECLADHGCRDALLHFRRCVGDNCVAAKPSDCGLCTSDSPLAVEVNECLNDCGGGCGLAGAASLCESYCSCMRDQCSSNLPGAGYGACVDACRAGSTTVADPHGIFATAPAPWFVHCLWEHCQRASPNDGFHCDHAIGDDKVNVCPPPAAPDPGAKLCTYPKGYGNAPCNTDGDCCSSCKTDLGVCAAP